MLWRRSFIDLRNVHFFVFFRRLNKPIAEHVITYHDSLLSMTSAPPLNIQGLTCYYGDQLVLDRLSLTLNAGEILGITGAAGAGISTLIKATLLLVAPRAGRVLVFSKPHELSSSRALLAYLPEDIKTPGHLMGYDIINMTRTVHGEEKAKASVDELAIDLDLPLKLLARPTRDYTREDIQKLGLVALLSMDRPILMLDQPMASISPAARRGLTSRLQDHVTKGGAALLGSHFVDDHHGIANRLATLKDGQLQTQVSSDKHLQAKREKPCQTPHPPASIA